MKVKKSELLAAVEACLPGISDIGKSFVEGANSLLFSSGWIHSFNASISVSAPTPWNELEGAVSAKELFGILGKIKDDAIEITVTEKAFRLTGKKAEIDLALLQGSIQPLISEVLDGIEEWKPLPADFNQAVAACSIQGNATPHAGFFVSGAVMFSTDEKRVNKWALQDSMEQFWITDEAAAALLKLGDFEGYSLSNSWLHLQTAEGICFSCVRLNDLAWQKSRCEEIFASHTYKKGDLKNTLPAALFEAVERASVLFTDILGEKAVKLTVGPADIKVTSNSYAGKYKEVVAWETPFAEDFKPFSIVVNTGMFKYAFNRGASFFVKNIEMGHKIHTHLIFEQGAFTHLMTTIIDTEK